MTEKLTEERKVTRKEGPAQENHELIDNTSELDLFDGVKDVEFGDPELMQEED